MDTRHCNIKLTLKEGEDKKKSFLEVSITGAGNEQKLSLFFQKTFSGAYLIFYYHLPNTY